MNISVENNSLKEFYSKVYTYASLAALPLAVTGLIANLFLFYILLTDNFFRKVTYYLILASVISDIISTIVSIIVYTHVAGFTLDYILGSVLCKGVFFVAQSSYGISMMNLCLIATDRYFAIVRPLTRFYRIYKKRILISAEIMIWLLSLTVTSPKLIFMKVQRENTMMCEHDTITNWIASYLIAFIVIIYVIPSSIIALIYWQIVVHQKNYTQPGQCIGSESTEGKIQKRKFIRSLISINLSYILTTWPYFATLFGFAITRDSFIAVRNRSLAAFLLAFFSFSTTTSITILNPFIYFKFDANVRKSAKKVIKRLSLGLQETSSIVIQVEELPRS
ncbi:Neuropeptide SIFamide receptor [Trichoplax sp. H2]|nr:Neuropeptide SIFamide receptor [Trichoplax sp. H2]|eukprot:RDD39728.1 Neuropeptide SIFamide receptor [Trichoplax sp. H2]